MNVLITGGAGLVGSECCKLFSKKGYRVLCVDNYMRSRLFGAQGDTRVVMKKLKEEYPIENYEMDIRDEKILDLLKKVELVIHTAAQPSHPKSIDIPLKDFQINAYGTLFLLEALRKYNKNAVFIFCSTNKVYGDAPNYFAYKRVERRYEPIDPMLWNGFDENLRIDKTLHTPFGVSKTVADLYTQEYARLYGLKTGVFRMGCITGGAAMAVEQHNWEPFFVRKALKEETLSIYGYEGYQVRDIIHARDLALLFYEFVNNPQPGEVYNIGGGRKNSISLLEAINLIEEITGKQLNYKLDSVREGDHIWWITDLGKVKSHFSSWDVRIGISDIFKEIFEVQSMSLSCK